MIELDLDQIFYGYGDYFIRLLMVGWRRGWRMLEIPVFYRLRMHGHSKTQFLGIFGQYTVAILKLRLHLGTGQDAVKIRFPADSACHRESLYN